MTIKEIIKSASVFLGREDVSNYLNGKTEDVGKDTISTVSILVALTNLVIGELAGTFIHMKKTEMVNAKSGKVYYADLLERCMRVVCVSDESGNAINFEYTPEFMRVFADKVMVEYEYIPPNYDLESQVGYAESDISTCALAYGVCAEFCISQGSFDQAVMWHERYVDAVTNKKRVKNGYIKPRSFV